MNDALREMRKKILVAPTRCGSGHIPSAFSILEIVWTLYDRILKPEDTFILSKGHGALALYAVLHEKGMAKNFSNSFGCNGSDFGGHPDRKKLMAVSASTGSLGHGLAIGCGVALSRQIEKKPGRVYVLAGDGECMEGEIWEAAIIASRLRLSITCIVDDNRTHRLGNLLMKFKAFGWTSYTANGHDVDGLERVLAFKTDPLAVIAQTVKGYGSPTLETKSAAWHNRAPNADELKMLVDELG